MYQTVKSIHSYWAYLVLLILVIATLNALIKFFSNKDYSALDFKISLFTLITAHIQFLIGIATYFAADYFSMGLSMSNIMKNSALRSIIVEHPVAMLLAVVFITIGYSKHKKLLSSKRKFKTLTIFYTLALLLILAKIPWSAWLK